jgi:hypothetical protein
MKKLYLSITLLGMFILMFMITLIPTQASSYQAITLDTALSDLNNYTLREVFQDYNDFNNGSFDDGLTSWNVQTGNPDIEVEVINGELTILSISPNPGSVYVYQFVNFIQNNDYYMRFDYNIINGDLAQWLFDGYITVGREFIFPGSLIGESEYSNSFTPLNSGTDGYFIGLTAPDIYDIIKLDNFILVDLSSLGITLTQNQLDYYYDIYFALYNNINLDTFFTDGYDSGYSVGFNEGRDDAIDNNFTLMGLIELMIGVVLSMVGWIINIEIFNISIIGILSTLAVGIGIIWLLKLIRG